jgi:DTW domain-containing protein
MEVSPHEFTALLKNWLELPKKRFVRNPSVNTSGIQCDCAGLITLACEHLLIPKPYALVQPRAVHYFAILQEIGSSHISQVGPGSLLAWRKDRVPKSGDSGHVLVVAGRPQKRSESVYQLTIIDATKVHDGLAQRDIYVHTNAEGTLIGVQLHLTEAKVKRTAIYHAPLLNNRYCLGCGVPKKICLCHQIDVRQMDTEIIILRHPHERKKTLSTVSLIKQRYPQVLVKEGRVFSPIRNNNCALLFPDTVASDEASSRAGMHSGKDLHGGGEQTLLLLDATWRKAKRILHDNPWLAALPRVSLEPRARSDYLLRKGPGGAALSTVEAFALVQVDSVLQAHLWNFMTQQIEVMGADRYARNYRDHPNYSPPDR